MQLRQRGKPFPQYRFLLVASPLSPWHRRVRVRLGPSFITFRSQKFLLRSSQFIFQLIVEMTEEKAGIRSHIPAGIQGVGYLVKKRPPSYPMILVQIFSFLFPLFRFLTTLSPHSLSYSLYVYRVHIIVINIFLVLLSCKCTAHEFNRFGTPW